MTDSDMETVRAAIAAFQRGDVDEVLALNHPDGEFVNPDYAIEAGTRRGREEIETAVRRMMQFFDEVELESLERTADGRFLAVMRVRAGSAASGIALEALTGTAYTVRAGLIARYEWFRTPEEARAAVGL